MSLHIEPSQGHGKACKGCAKTGTLRVVERQPYTIQFTILKQFRFTNGDEDSLRKAYQKAQSFMQSALSSEEPKTE